MIDNHFRKILPDYTVWIIRIYSRIGISPNQISVASFLIALLASILVVKNYFYLAIIIWWMGRLLDGTDGIYARATGKTSLFGAYLDMLLDMASYSLMIIAFSLVFPALSLQWTLILFFYVLCITGALALGSLEKKKGLTANDNRGLRLAAGLAEGGETGIAYTIFLLFPQFINELAWAWIGALLITVTGRSILAYQELKGG